MIHKNTVLNRLAGPANLKARKLYNSLKKHYRSAKCPMCSSYPRYGVLIVKSDLSEHLKDINDGLLAANDLFKLKDAELIEIDQISARQYRITISECVPQEAAV